MRGLLLVALASLAAACGNHGHDGREWTAEELADLETKWGMEVRFCHSYLFIKSSWHPSYLPF